MLTAGPMTLSPFGRRAVGLVAILAAVLGVALGIETLALHLSTDPLADTRLYYDAATRLNTGLPLYGVAAAGEVGPYVSPPLLAILFRPLALLPFPVAAAAWQAVVLGAFVATLRRIGLRRPVLIALGCLALPILWALCIGQAETVVLVLLTLGTPASVALAGHLKLVPWLAAMYWFGRRDVASLVRCAAWAIGLAAVQLVLAPSDTIAYLRFDWLRTAFDFRSISPFVVSPVLWAAMVVVLAALAFRYARTRHGWALAVLLAVLANPRLLVYQLMSLLAAFGGPEPLDRAPGEVRP